MMYFINSFGSKHEYYERFLEYFNDQLKANNERSGAFKFAQASFSEQYGFQLFKELDLFLKEIIDVNDGRKSMHIPIRK